MKTYIRNLLDDLKKREEPLPPTVPEDLENQNLSSNLEERAKQLDEQAQDAEIRETLE